MEYEKLVAYLQDMDAYYILAEAYDNGALDITERQWQEFKELWWELEDERVMS